MSEVREDPHFFFGRHALLALLAERLAEAPPHRPIVLQGGGGMGKTAVLQQIQAGRMGAGFVTAYVDLATINPDSMSQLLWELASTFAPQLGRTEPLSRPDFVADPEKAFEAAVLQIDDTVARAGDRQIILLFDNFHILQRRFSNRRGFENRFTQWQHHLQDVPTLYTIFTISSGDDDRTALFDRARRYHIEPMEPTATSDLVRALSSYTFYSDVATYIGEASGGNPGTIIRVMAALKATAQNNPNWQPTVADVAGLHVLAPETAVSHRPVYQCVHPETAVVAAAKTGKRTVRLAGVMVGLIAVIILLLAIFLPYQRDRLAAETGLAIGLITPTATSTPLPIIDYEATPRITRTTSTPKPPTSTPTQTPTAVPTITPTMPPTSTPSPTSIPRSIIRDRDGMEMLLISAGTFTMGGRENDYAASPDERPLHEVQLDNFYMDKYEVNLEQYAAFINRQEGNGDLCDTPANCVLARQDALFSFLDKQDVGDGTIQYFPLAGYGNYPANNISWDGAVAYCDYVDGRLPTEAEWEYAARGEDGRLYPWGDEFPNETRAIFNSESFDNLVPVDGLPDGASAFGIYGMAGSLWEWTADWYDERYYLESPLLNPQGPSRGLTKVIRGGAWPFNNQADRIRSSNRNALAPEQLHSIVGFRCVREKE